MRHCFESANVSKVSPQTGHMKTVTQKIREMAEIEVETAKSSKKYQKKCLSLELNFLG